MNTNDNDFGNSDGSDDNHDGNNDRMEIMIIFNLVIIYP